ncbi:MAG: ABC transporter ATP-binding protein [Devosia sp.]|uniref:ABC transporter ATP-binding protein n=1 Tax=Devosia sp. TaxID=1871048 RepID=UPI003392520B
MTTITLDAVGKSFGDNRALTDISLQFPAGSFTALLGPSGCGKTTLLRLIAGFEQPSTGVVRFDGNVMADGVRMVPPEERNLGIVFQSYALWPHMDVAANVAYPLKGRGFKRDEIERRTAEALAVVSLRGYEHRSVDALSGGQRQRVALARCLVTGTKIILLDEPLANLDVHLRAAMLDVFADTHERTGATIVFVTHDQSEALALADTIVVLDGGRVQQIGTPEEIYAEPANAMVAGFVGRGSLVAASHGFPVRGLPVPNGKVLVRPHAVHLAENGLPASAERVRYTGASYETTLRLANGDTLFADLPRQLAIGEHVHLTVDDAWSVPA